MIIFFKLIGIINLCLVVIGTIGNLLVFRVCLHINNTATFVFLRYLSLADIFSLYFWNINHFIEAFFNIQVLSISRYACKFVNFFQFCSLQSSAWLLVYIFVKYLYLLYVAFIVKLMFIIFC